LPHLKRPLQVRQLPQLTELDQPSVTVINIAADRQKFMTLTGELS